MRVVIVQELVTHYRIELYQRLRRALAAEGIELDVVHGQAHTSRQRNDEVRLPWATVIKNRQLGPDGSAAVWQPILRIVKGADLVVVEQANRMLVNYVLLAWQRLGGPRVALWGHGAHLQSSNPDGVRERFKARIARLPHWFFAYTEGAAQRARAAGMDPARITVLNNALDTDGLRANFATLHTTRVPHRCGFLGSLVATKRIDFLVAAADVLAAELADFELVVVGDGPLAELIRDRPYVTALGAINDESRVEPLASCELMLNPGMVGLNALDSFACQTPIVTIAGVGHSPEAEYLEESNSVMLPEGTTPQAYAHAVIELLGTDLTALREGCAASAEVYTLDHMVERYAEGIRQALP